MSFMKYGSLTKEILHVLADTGYTVLDGFLPPQYPEAKLARILLGVDRRRSRSDAKHLLSSTLHRLKQQGLVNCTWHHKTAQWKLTHGGKIFLAKINAAEKNPYELSPEDGIIRIVAFDIPEKLRTKRNWLREQLLACDYHLLQRSIFLGKRPLPDAFILRVDEMRIRKYLHIASLTQSGTIQEKP